MAIFALFPVLMFFFWSKINNWGVVGYLCFLAFGLFGVIMLTSLALAMEGGYIVVHTQNVTNLVPIMGAKMNYQVSHYTEVHKISSSTNSSLAEFLASSSSPLNGANVNCMGIFLAKVGAPSGTVKFGLMDGSNNVVGEFGTVPASTLTTDYTWQEFCASNNAAYPLATGDRIGVQFAAGDNSNYVIAHGSVPETIGGANLQYYNGGWTNEANADVVMSLWQLNSPTGSFASNTTTNQDIWVNQFQTVFGYILLGLAIMLGLIWLYVLITSSFILMDKLSKRKSIQLEGREQ